jgi:hypothetical protein
LQLEVAQGLALIKKAGVKPFVLPGDKPPGADDLIATWSYIFEDELYPHAVREVDAPRIAEAFRLAARRIPRWPTPAEVIDLMPRRPERQKIKNNRSEEEVMRGRGKIVSILRELKRNNGLVSREFIQKMQNECAD